MEKYLKCAFLFCLLLSLQEYFETEVDAVEMRGQRDFFYILGSPFFSTSILLGKGGRGKFVVSNLCSLIEK